MVDITDWDNGGFVINLEDFFPHHCEWMSKFIADVGAEGFSASSNDATSLHLSLLKKNALTAVA